MNLYNLTSDYLYIQSLIENGEEDIFLTSALAELSEDIEKKAENYAKVIKNLDSQIVGITEEIKRLTECKKTIENGISRLKENLQTSMIATGKRKFKTNLFSFNIQKNGGALPVIVDVPVEELPDELCKITREPNKTAIAKYIEETGDVTQFHFGERGESLRIK